MTLVGLKEPCPSEIRPTQELEERLREVEVEGVVLLPGGFPGEGLCATCHPDTRVANSDPGMEHRFQG